MAIPWWGEIETALASGDWISHLLIPLKKRQEKMLWDDDAVLCQDNGLDTFIRC